MTQPAAPKLIADIGGTNARFALLDADGRIHAHKTLPCAEQADFVSAVQAYLLAVGSPPVSEAAVAIANPVDGDLIRMTNHNWTFSIEASRRALGLKRLLFRNDFTALALSLPHLPAADCRQIGGRPADTPQPLAVLGPGTGLGVSGLLPCAGGQWVAVSGEGGHVSVSPGNARECDILQLCWSRFGHVSAERLISGMGLQNLYAAICQLEGVTAEGLSPADISARAMAGGDGICEEALAVFCAQLGSVSGNLALTLGATGGVYIGGGIVPRLGDFFVNSAFRERFQAKGRFHDYLAAIPVYVIHNPHPALIGISQCFKDGSSA
ncbi:glucokinase [Granulosicoccaceae sp. 1_MG-2023]|nr:glucokinase [Granulosicoccaceae sp. 1_MG-2023]